MLENQGIFNLAARSEANAALARNTTLLHAQTKPATQSGSSASGGGWNLMTDTKVSPAAKLKAFLKDVLDKTDDNLISDDMMKRLDTASKSDNKEIAAEKLRQAKQKLQSLRTQAQMAAATGDPKTLRRIAQEAAQAAHDVAAAVRGLAEGIAATAMTADGSTSATVPNAAATSDANAPQQAGGASPAAETPAAETSADASSDAAAPLSETAADGRPARDAKDAKGEPSPYTGPVPQGTDPISWGREALRKLGDEAHAAIAQARGIIAFVAQLARNARKHRPDPEEDKAYRDLQSSVNDAEHDVDAAIGAATKEIESGSSDAGDGAVGDTGTPAADAGSDSGLGLVIDSTTVVVQTTTVVAVGTDITV